jgi:hypothetical protein
MQAALHPRDGQQQVRGLAIAGTYDKAPERPGMWVG